MISNTLPRHHKSWLVYSKAKQVLINFTQLHMEVSLGDYNMKILHHLLALYYHFQQRSGKVRSCVDYVKRMQFEVINREMFLHAKEFHFLGHVVSENGVETDPDKIEKVKNWPVPKNAEELGSFIAFTVYYRRFQARKTTYRFCNSLPINKEEI